jgi:transcriptional regulator with XRE-family HTH domain
MSHLSALFREARMRAGLSIKQVARRTGFRNQPKQIRVLERLESGNDPFPKAVYLERFAAILGIELADVVQAMSLDYDEYEHACETPVQPYLVLRAVPGFYIHRSLPDGCTLEQAEEEALKMARGTRLHVALVYKRGRAIYFSPDGGRCEGGTPVMKIGRTGRREMAILRRRMKVPREPGCE